MGTILNYSAIATPLSIWFDDVCCLSASYHHADTCGFYDAAILTIPHHTTGGAHRVAWLYLSVRLRGVQAVGCNNSVWLGFGYAPDPTRPHLVHPPAFSGREDRDEYAGMLDCCPSCPVLPSSMTGYDRSTHAINQSRSLSVALNYTRFADVCNFNDVIHRRHGCLRCTCQKQLALCASN